MTTKTDSVDAEPKVEPVTVSSSSALSRVLAGLRSEVSRLVATLFLLTATVYLFVGHVDGRLERGDRIRFVQPQACSGDEPHYLVIINSLLFDHDLRIDRAHARVAAGGYEAGVRWRGILFGGHSVLVNRRTGKSVWCVQLCGDKEAKAVGGNPRDLAEFPAHPIAYPAFVALLAFPFQSGRTQVEPLIGEISILLSIAGVLLAFTAARQGGLRAKPALACALLLGFASSWLPYARSYFSDVSIGLFLLLGFLALRKNRPAWAGVAVGVAIAMKSLFALCGFAWILERLWARRFREALLLSVSTGLCGVALLCSNMALLRSPVTYGNSPSWAWARGLESFVNTLVGGTHGLVAFVPWAFIPFIWGVVSARPGATSKPGLLSVDARRQLVLPSLLCLACLSALGGGPGYCYGPRYWVPLLPFLSILAIDFVVAGKAWRTVLVGVLAAVAMLIAVTGAIRYHLLFSQPSAAALFAPSGTDYSSLPR